MLRALSAPFRRSEIWRIFDFFQESVRDFLLAMSLVLVSSRVWMILRPFALIVEPVSVMSTMASARPSTTLASVAPQENSTSTGMVRSAK